MNISIKLIILSLCVYIEVQNCCAKMSKTFSYFAYGSNLLAQRIHMNSPSAVRKGYGKLKDYRLDFNLFSNRWKGASATIVPSKNSTVWGAIWEIDLDTLEDLDNQEGVPQNIYFALEVNIEEPNGNKIKCRVYQQCETPPEIKGEKRPQNRIPSPIYLKTIILGAAESNLPQDYQEYLRSLPDNGYDGPYNISLDLDK